MKNEHSDDESYTWSSNVQPDRSKSDFYCQVCDSHMNSEQMWESHITGKRHLKNMKKEPGEKPSKVKTVKQDDVQPFIQKRLDAVTEPVVGLNYICELQRFGSVSDPSYTCYLCHATSGSSGIISHITSAKHRTNYLKEVDPEGFELLESMKVSKQMKESLVADKASQWEAKEGRGEIEVKLEKSKYGPFGATSKRHFDDDNEYDLGAPSKRSMMDPRVPMGPQNPLAGGKIGFNPKDIRLFNIDTKLRMLEELSRNDITNDLEARIVMQTLNLLTQCLMQYKIRRLPSDLQGRLAREILSGDLEGLQNALNMPSFRNSGSNVRANVESFFPQMARQGGGGGGGGGSWGPLMPSGELRSPRGSWGNMPERQFGGRLPSTTQGDPDIWERRVF